MSSKAFRVQKMEKERVRKKRKQCKRGNKVKEVPRMGEGGDASF